MSARYPDSSPRHQTSVTINFNRRLEKWSRLEIGSFLEFVYEFNLIISSYGFPPLGQLFLWSDFKFKNDDLRNMAANG